MTRLTRRSEAQAALLAARKKAATRYQTKSTTHGEPS
jgi:hypothetical protein